MFELILMLQILDNFLSDDELSEILSIIDSSTWKHEGYSNPNEDTIFWRMLISDDMFIEKILSKLEKHTKKKYEICKHDNTLKGDANGQTYGLDGSWHFDDDREDMYTLIIYVSNITPENIKNNGGYIHFNLNDILMNVEPYIKRAVFFDSRILHRGMAPLNKNMLRISIAFKLKEIK